MSLEPTDEQKEELRCKIQAHLPGWKLENLYQRHGRWFGLIGADVDYSISDALANVHEVQPMLRVRVEQRYWKDHLTRKTYDEVMAMCRRLLKGNPNNKFVRDQYPQIFAEITDGQREQTTHREPSHAA